MKHKKITTGNYNCNRSLVNESFFKALDAFIPNDIKGKTCYIDDDYIHADNLFYDNRIQKVISEDEWEKNCADYTREQRKSQEEALGKQGLLEAYISLEKYLQSHNSIKMISCDASKNWQAPYKIVKRKLTYGYKLCSFEIINNIVIWGIIVYDRAIKENDCIRGMDTCYLMYTDGIIVEAVPLLDYKLMRGENYISSTINDNTYVDISNYVKGN